MTDTIVLKMPEEKVIEESTDTAIDDALKVLEVATVIADKIDEAKDDEIDEELREVFSRFDLILDEIRRLQGRFDALEDKIESMRALEVAEVVVENDAEELDEILDVAELVEEPAPIVEDVPVAVTPQIRTKKVRKWIQ